MSNLALLGQAGDIIDSLARGEAVEIALPMGGVVRAVPEQVVDDFGDPVIGRDGGELFNLHVQSDAAGGLVKAVIQMERQSVNYYIQKARNLMPRLQVTAQRLMLRSGRE